MLIKPQNRDNSREGFIEEDVEIDGRIIKGIIDTGSNLTLLSYNVYLYDFSNIKLNPPDIVLRDAQQRYVKVIGSFNQMIKLKPQEHKIKIYVVKELAKPLILGLDFVHCFD
ncbi:hypothetical protein RF11_04644 [Thelohanellus kitauei]|uniref:Retropepsins domain-containing protein n=1 Tax=Thelohanellus kitauei TaxID=669202 RepID=A0A0C2NK14_THEKT|nr:hypothetical protein RF11_04644 [Thelohanellus kitauei]